MKIGRTLLFIFIGALVLLAGYFATYETAKFVFRSSKTAEQAAIQTFQCYCRHMGLASDDFSGPVAQGQETSPFSFEWKAKQDPSAAILVHVSYFPYESKAFADFDNTKFRRVAVPPMMPFCD